LGAGIKKRTEEGPIGKGASETQELRPFKKKVTVFPNPALFSSVILKKKLISPLSP
jgi:hypothetical protein